MTVGALSAAMSGAGPSYFALCGSEYVAHSAVRAMRDAFGSVGVESFGVVSSLSTPGGRIL